MRTLFDPTVRTVISSLYKDLRRSQRAKTAAAVTDRNKSIPVFYPDGHALAAHAVTGAPAKKQSVVSGYFLLLRNKKQIILTRRGLRTGHMAAKK